MNEIVQLSIAAITIAALDYFIRPIRLRKYLGGAFFIGGWITLFWSNNQLLGFDVGIIGFTLVCTGGSLLFRKPFHERSI